MRQEDQTGHVLRVSVTLVQAALRLVRRIAVNGVMGRPQTFSAVLGETVVDTLSQLGPTFIKVGQILGTRADILPPNAIAALSRLYDNLPPAPNETLEKNFYAEFGLQVDEAFSTWDPTPVASASVASVYRAWLPDGTAVIVKVLRPGIANVVAADLAMLRRVSDVIQRFPGARELPLRAIVDELGVSLERQLDLRLEAAANRRIRDALRHEPDIIIPTLVERYCSGSILTMRPLPAIQESDAQVGAERALLRMLGALYRMIFVEGFIHCDLHPGNLRFYPDGRAALLDFGFMAEMPTPDRHAFTQFFYAMATGDGAACAEIALQTAASCRPGLDRAAFEQEMIAIVDEVAGKTARDFSVGRFVIRMFALMRQHGVRGTTAFIMAIMALLELEGLAKSIGVDLDFQGEARPYLFRASLTAVRSHSMASENIDSFIKEQLVNMPVAPAVNHADDTV